jgi:hypothetical protein
VFTQRRWFQCLIVALGVLALFAGDRPAHASWTIDDFEVASVITETHTANATAAHTINANNHGMSVADGLASGWGGCGFPPPGTPLFDAESSESNVNWQRVCIQNGATNLVVDVAASIAITTVMDGTCGQLSASAEAWASIPQAGLYLHDAIGANDEYAQGTPDQIEIGVTTTITGTTRAKGSGSAGGTSESLWTSEATVWIGPAS